MQGARVVHMWALGRLVTLGLCVTKRALPEWILRTTLPSMKDLVSTK